MTLRGQKLTGLLMQQKRREYQALSQEEFAEYVRLGQLATQQHAAGQETFPCMSRRARSGRGRQHGDGNRAYLIEDPEQARAFEQSVLDGHAMGLPQLQAMHGLPFQHAFDKYLRNQAAYFFRVKEAEKIKETELRDALFENEQGRRDGILQYRRGLREVRHVEWTAFPHPCPALSARFVAGQAVPGTWERDIGADPESIMEQEATWKRHSLGIKGASWQTPDPGLRGRRSRCAQDCECHCQHDTAVARLLHERLRQYLVGLIAQDASVLPNITNGFVVLHWRLSAPTNGADRESESDTQDLFTHIALYYIKPWRPTLAPLVVLPPHECDRVQRLSAESLEGPLHFRASVTESGAVFLTTIWQWLKTLNVETKISVQLWELSRRVLPTATLTAVVARKCAIPALTLWAGPDEEHFVHRPRRAAYDIFDEERDREREPSQAHPPKSFS